MYTPLDNEGDFSNEEQPVPVSLSSAGLGSSGRSPQEESDLANAVDDFFNTPAQPQKSAQPKVNKQSLTQHVSFGQSDVKKGKAYGPGLSGLMSSNAAIGLGQSLFQLGKDAALGLDDFVSGNSTKREYSERKKAQSEERKNLGIGLGRSVPRGPQMMLDGESLASDPAVQRTPSGEEAAQTQLLLAKRDYSDFANEKDPFKQTMIGVDMLTHAAASTPTTAGIVKSALSGLNALSLGTFQKFSNSEGDQVMQGLGLQPTPKPKEGVDPGNLANITTGSYTGDVVAQTIGDLAGALPAFGAIEGVLAPFQLSKAELLGTTMALHSTITGAVEGKSVPDLVMGSAISFSTGASLGIASKFSEGLAGPINNTALRAAASYGPNVIAGGATGALAAVAESALHGELPTGQELATSAATQAALGGLGGKHVMAETAPLRVRKALVLKKGVDLSHMNEVSGKLLVVMDKYLEEQGVAGRITSAARPPKSGIKSNHDHGQAVDIVTGNGKAMRNHAELLRKAGFDATFEEGGQKNANGSVATADHIHVDLKKTGAKTEAALRELGLLDETAPNSQNEAAPNEATPNVEPIPEPPKPPDAFIETKDKPVNDNADNQGTLGERNQPEHRAGDDGIRSDETDRQSPPEVAAARGADSLGDSTESSRSLEEEGRAKLQARDERANDNATSDEAKQLADSLLPDGEKDRLQSTELPGRPGEGGVVEPDRGLAPESLSAGTSREGSSSQSKDSEVPRGASQESSRGTGKEEPKPEVGKNGEAIIHRVPVSEIHTDPEAFQFKSNTDADGVTKETLKDAPFNETLAGIIQVWRDPNDGKIYVVNGHHRLARAREVGHGSLNVQFLDAANRAEARVQGALTNIAEGHGEAIDVAKVIREGGYTADGLRDKGIAPSSKLAQKGLALSNLAKPLFERVATGQMKEAHGVAIGEKIRDPQLQMAVVKEIESSPRITDGEVRELVDEVVASPTEVTQTESLFGTEETTKSLARDRRKIKHDIGEIFRKSKRIFGFVGNAERAKTLEGGGNTIDVEGSKSKAESAAQTAEVFDRLKNTQELTDIFNRAAKSAQGKKGKERDAVINAAAKEVEKAVDGILGRESDALKKEDAIPDPEANLFDKPTSSAKPDEKQGKSDENQGKADEAKAEEVAANEEFPPLGDDIVSPNEPQSSAGQLNSEVFPGASIVAEEVTDVVRKDVYEKVQKIGRGIATTFRSLQKIFAPSTRGEAARLTKLSMRSHMAEMAREADKLNYALKAARDEMGRLSKADSYEFIRRMELGMPQVSTGLDEIAGTLRKIMDRKRDIVRALGEGKLEQYYENYFPHIWDDPKKAGGVWQNLSKRPLEGSKSFLRRREYELFAEGLKAGLRPVSNNPIELVMLKMREVDKYIMSHRALAELKGMGVLTFERGDTPPPAGYTAINDRVGKVYAPPKEGDIGRVIIGNWYAPEPAARIINNYLAPGLRGKNELVDVAMNLGSAMNMIQLSWSAFHFSFVVSDSITSKVALGVEQLFRNKAPLKAARTIGTSIIAPIENSILGHKMAKAWEDPGSQSPRIQHLADLMQKAGGRAKMDSFYQTNITSRMVRMWKDGEHLRASLRIPLAITEQVMRPLLEFVVPRMKMGAFAQLAKNEMELLGPNASEAQIRDALGKAWDSIDNRLGQLVYDNLFWSKTTKEVLMIFTRSLGWNLGTWRELGGGIGDVGRAANNLVHGRDVEFSHRMAYAIALPFTTAMMGAMYQFLTTGEAPKDTKDLFFPRDGGVDEHGNATRVALPSYMKDVYAYGTDLHDAATVGGNPLRTVGHKMHPMIAATIEMLTNEDYYGTKIFETDPATEWYEPKQILNLGEQAAKFAAKQFVPFAVIGALRQQKLQRGFSAKSLAPFVGIVPATKEINETPATKLVAKYVSESMKSGSRSQAESERYQLRGEIVRHIRLGEYDDAEKKFEEGYRAGILSLDDRNRVVKDASLDPFTKNVKNHLKLDQAIDVYEKGTLEERGKIRGVVRDKWKNMKPREMPRMEYQRLYRRMLEVDNLQYARPQTQGNR